MSAPVSAAVAAASSTSPVAAGDAVAALDSIDATRRSARKRVIFHDDGSSEIAESAVDPIASSRRAPAAKKAKPDNDTAAAADAAASAAQPAAFRVSARIVLDANLKPQLSESPYPELGQRPAMHTEYDAFHTRSFIHGFVLTAHRAFAEHLTLRLTPDDFWTVITQGVGQHINMNAERLRHKFVAHEGKKEIRIRRDQFVRGKTTRKDWMGVVPELSEKVRTLDNGNSGIMQHIVQQFSTTTPLHTFCYQAALLSSMQAYCKYVVKTWCGIPAIELAGTVADWQQLLDATKALDLVGLDEQLHPWHTRILPILESLVRVRLNAEVDQTTLADRDFLDGIYKYQRRSGKPHINGWISALFPYLGRRGEKNFDRLTRHLKYDCLNRDESTRQVQVKTDQFPSGRVSFPFVWEYLGTAFQMSIHAGFDTPRVVDGSVIECAHAFAVEYADDNGEAPAAN